MQRLQAGDLVGERYEVIQQVVRRDIGGVYQARDRVLGELVAVKLVHQAPAEFVERLRREAAILRTIVHPHIAQFLDYGVTRDEHYLVERWIDGPTLRRQLDIKGLTPVEALALARDISSGLAEAHDLDVIHRDIKPSNILRGDAGWTIIDFGMARVLGDNTHSTRTGVVVGTVGYMAPEQASSVKDIGAAADVFSLGCVLYEALTGTVAFEGDSQVAVQAKLFVADPAPLDRFVAGIPDALAELVMSCMHKAAAARPANGRELVERLAAIEEGTLPRHEARRVRHREIATAPTPSTPNLSVVLTAPRPELTPLTLVAWREQAARAVAGLGGEVMVAPSGSAVFLTKGTPTRSCVNAAADAALRLFERAPDVAMAIVSAQAASELEPLLETAGGEVERAGIAKLFEDSAVSTRGARLDTLSVGHLGREFEIVTIEGVTYLAGRR